MSILRREKPMNHPDTQSDLAELVLKNIHDGVIITDSAGIVKFINPAALTMTGGLSMAQALGLDYGLLLKLESKEGRELSEAENPLIQAMKTGQQLEKFQASLTVGQTDKQIPVAISMLPVDGTERIITFRDITKELAEEGEQAEFISTASHEMRTPVATIDGYLMLALNPQTATIDERARGYLTAAEKASKHLGKLFQDLLDVTKLDDGHIKAHFVPADMTELIRTISTDYVQRAQEAKLTFTFGADEGVDFNSSHQIDQVVYGYIDTDFMREIMDNLIENAIKYTPAGGSIYVNVRGDGDRVLINVTDTGIGISADDLGHIFQKFYRADNSDTRTIGGTGLGLYLVKQRAEAMGGRVWAESAFGEGSTFFVSLPRITNDEYEKRMIVIRNQQIQEQIQSERGAVPKSAPLEGAAVALPPEQTSVPTATQPVPAPATPTPSETPPVTATPTPSETPPAPPTVGVGQPGQPSQANPAPEPSSPPGANIPPTQEANLTTTNTTAAATPVVANTPTATNNNLNGEKQ